MEVGAIENAKVELIVYHVSWLELLRLGASETKIFKFW